MVLPFVLGAAAAPVHHHHDTPIVAAAGFANIDSLGLTAPLIHTLGYLAVTAALAVTIYEKVGLRVLRRAWINLDVLWGVALIASGLSAVLL
jgi:hypothetical protein